MTGLVTSLRERKRERENSLDGVLIGNHVVAKQTRLCQYLLVTLSRVFTLFLFTIQARFRTVTGNMTWLATVVASAFIVRLTLWTITCQMADFFALVACLA